MTDYVVAGLVKRRAELAGEIERTHEALRKMVLDLENLDATIIQFAPGFEPEAIRAKTFRPPEDWSKRGEMTRVILSVLRCAAGPDIAYQLLVERALDKNDQRLAKLMCKRVGVALRARGNAVRFGAWRGRAYTAYGK